ncbi:MAG: hypothetical protein IT580_08005 [Verrucomicrobiales bacterium]|nr:hypothetical protein [Verrucomicrobiales bacterium]
MNPDLALLPWVSTSFAGVSLIFTALGLLRHAAINRRQSNAAIFLDCVKRYERIMEGYPSGAWEKRLQREDTGLPASSASLRLAMIRHFHLFCEERYLHQRGYFSEGIWSVWEDLFHRYLRGGLVRREWPDLRVEFESDLEFLRWCERRIAESP